jgi:hypothetical protein
MNISSVVMVSMAAVAAMALTGCAKKEPVSAPVVSMSLADSYFLYSFAVRDAKALEGKAVPDIAVRNEGAVAVYDFTDHVIKECGTHVNGSVTITDSGDVLEIQADFPKVEKNPYKITSFAYKMTEPKGNYKQTTGTATVNGTEYPIGEIIATSGF